VGGSPRRREESSPLRLFLSLLDLLRDRLLEESSPLRLFLSLLDLLRDRLLLLLCLLRFRSPPLLLSLPDLDCLLRLLRPSLLLLLLPLRLLRLRRSLLRDLERCLGRLRVVARGSWTAAVAVVVARPAIGFRRASIAPRLGHSLHWCCGGVRLDTKPLFAKLLTSPPPRTPRHTTKKAYLRDIVLLPGQPEPRRAFLGCVPVDTAPCKQVLAHLPRISGGGNQSLADDEVRDLQAAQPHHDERLSLSRGEDVGASVLDGDLLARHTCRDGKRINHNNDQL
jgi:hypothetical protein